MRCLCLVLYFACLVTILLLGCSVHACSCTICSRVYYITFYDAVAAQEWVLSPEMCICLCIYVLSCEKGKLIILLCAFSYAFRVSEKMPLYDILNEFQKGHSHIAVVYKDLNETPKKAKEGEHLESLYSWFPLSLLLYFPLYLIRSNILGYLGEILNQT